MTDPADAVYCRTPGAGEAPPTGAATLELSEAARWLAAAPDGSEAELDPALMAWLGPGGCPGLAAIVTPPSATSKTETEEGASLARALELAPAVAAHASECAACSDRLRAMVSVAELLSRDAPPTASDTPPAASADPDRRVTRRASLVRSSAPDRGGRPRRVAVACTSALAAAGAGAVAYLAWPSGSGPAAAPSRSATAALSELPQGGSSLLLDPAATKTGTLHLSDVGRRPVSWQASTTAPWLQVAPATGQLTPGQSVSLALDVVGNQAAGLRATITVNGNDGSVTAAQYAP